MKYSLLIICIWVALFGSAAIDKKISKEEYVNAWKQTAINQMMVSKIPASITLAQGILESANGNSDLAIKGKNHFGIKCSDWKGEKMYINDDSDNECFRVYSNAEDSYFDHSSFLSGKTRYSKLFLLDQTDYKGWANELKNAGYATNPKYPELLIEIIESLKLNELDQKGSSTPKMNSELTASAITNNSHTVVLHANKVKYIVAKKGDTFYKISKEFDLGLWQLYRYNDFDSKKDVLEVGDIIYIQPKRKHSKSKEKSIKTTSTVSLRQISQNEAVKLEALMRMNDITSPDELIKKGEIIALK